MIGSNVARRYAKALFELGVDAGTLASLVAEVRAIADAYAGSSELRSTLDNPLVPHAAKRAILAEIADHAQASTIVKNAILLLGDRRRMHALPAIAQVLHEMSDLREGILRAEVTTATRLGDAYYARLQQQLEKMTGKRVVIDGSLRTRLHEMTHALLPN
jgi:F-type H+-transporting ATPase subunit delta